MMKTSESQSVNKEDYKKSILQILLFESKEKSAIKEIEADESKSFAEKEDLKKKFAEEQKAINLQKNVLLKCVENSDLAELSMIIRVIQEIYVEQRDLKPLAKKLLVSQPFRKQIGNFRKNDFGAAYELVAFVSSKFPVDDYPMFTLKPAGAIYGAEVDKTGKGSTFLPPLSNEEIVKCLEVFLEKDRWALYNWIMAIFAFDETLVVNGYKDKFIKERQELLLDTIELLKKDSRYQTAMAEKLFEKGDLARLVNLQKVGGQAELKVKELEGNVKSLEEEAKEKEEAFRVRAERQKAIIDEKQLMIETLQAKLKKFDELSEKLSVYMKKYEAQVSMNERITIENDIRVHEAEKHIGIVESENTKLQVELTETKDLYENVKSDLSLKIAEIKRLSDDTANIELKAKEGLLQELVGALKEQLYYIILYYLELKENGSLEKDSIEMFGDTITNVRTALNSVGIEMFGSVDEEIIYDSSLHDSMGYKLSNGEKVVLRVPGWKINGVIYAKAQVEKEN